MRRISLPVPAVALTFDADASRERDGVARAGGRAADGVIGGAAVDLDAVAVAERQRAGDVGADQVVLDECAGRARVEPDARGGIGRDDVPVACRRAADRDPGGAIHEHAERPVSQGLGAGIVGADAVAQDHDARGGGPGDRHSRPGVGRDHVARALRRAADGDARGVERHARAGIGQRLGSGLIRADVVALDHGVRGAGVDVDAVAGVSRNDVPGQTGRAADRGAGPARDDDSAGPVGHGGRALHIGADQVARHDRSHRG